MVPLYGYSPGAALQEGGLSPAVPPGKAQFPAAIDLKAHMVKDELRTALVSKCQIRDVDHGHIAFLLCADPHVRSGAPQISANAAHMSVSSVISDSPCFCAAKTAAGEQTSPAAGHTAFTPHPGLCDTWVRSAVCLPAMAWKRRRVFAAATLYAKTRRSDPHLHTPPIIHQSPVILAHFRRDCKPPLMLPPSER